MYLPGKGLGSLTLIASQYDGALMDEAAAPNGLDGALQSVRPLLCRRASAAIDKAVRAMTRSGASHKLITLLSACRRPIFVSAVAQRMAHKCTEEFDPLEQVVAQHLWPERAPSRGELEEIGNFQEAQAVFDGLLAGKEELLRQKAAAFVVTADHELHLQLGLALRAVAQRLDRLLEGKRRLDIRQEELAAQINALRRSLSGEFERYLAPLDSMIASALLRLNSIVTKGGDPPVQMELKVLSHSRQVSAVQLAKPATWFTRKSIYYNEELSRLVIDPTEVRAHLMRTWEIAASLCEAALRPMADRSALSNGLCRAAREQLGENGISPSPGFLSRSVERAISLLRPPRFPASPSEEELLPAQFTAPVGGAAEQQELCHAAGETAERLAGRLRRYLQDCPLSWWESAHAALDMLCEQLGQEYALRQKALLEQSAEAGREIARLRELTDMLQQRC